MSLSIAFSASSDTYSTVIEFNSVNPVDSEYNVTVSSSVSTSASSSNYTISLNLTPPEVPETPVVVQESSGGGGSSSSSSGGSSIIFPSSQEVELILQNTLTTIDESGDYEFSLLGTNYTIEIDIENQSAIISDRFFPRVLDAGENFVDIDNDGKIDVVIDITFGNAITVLMSPYMPIEESVAETENEITANVVEEVVAEEITEDTTTTQPVNYLPYVIGVVLAGMLLAFVLIQKRPRKNKFVAEHPGDKNEEPFVKYAIKHLDQGFSEEQLRQLYLRVGWTQEQFDYYMKEVREIIYKRKQK